MINLPILESRPDVMGDRCPSPLPHFLRETALAIPVPQGEFIGSAMARFFKKRSLVCENQGSIHGGYKFALVGIEPEVKVNEKLIRHLAAKMEEPVRATGAGNEKLEVLADHLMQEPEDFDEIRIT